MVCKFCGNTIEDSSEFCFICGNKVMKEEAPAVYTEAAPAEVPVVAAPAPEAQPIYAQQAPVYAQQAYAQPAAPVAAPEAAPAEEGKKKKNKKDKKDKSVCSKAKKFFAALFAITFVLQFIPWIWYKNAKKAGYEEKAVAILNSLMTGLCIFMAIICGVLIKTNMF